MSRRLLVLAACLAAACADAQHTDGPARVVSLLELSALTVQQGRSQALQLPVPAHARRLRVTVSGPAHVWLALADLRAPDGAVLVAADWRDHDPTRGEACLTCPLRLLPARGAFAATWPQTHDDGVHKGTWRLQILAWTRAGSQGPLLPWSGPLQVRADALVGTLPPADLTLPVRVLLPGKTQDPRVDPLITRARELLEPAGVRLQPVTVHPVASQWQVLDASPDALDLQELAAATADLPPGLRLVLADELRSEAGTPLLGACPGLPGTAATVVAVAQGPAPEALLGTVAAHEIGHWLGLFHPAEAALNGPLVGVQDPLPDTMPHDPANVMHPAATAQAREFSAGQAAVMRGQPIGSGAAR